ncbi:7-cyano-7-deazaguanine/7-aminomethyl-7-deazaguanine transporter [Legionella waltersii]|uniref:Probable queuosine precursor transporter n=1 Tax=Legionella waltersii TaxID=66969 RepID=A0A0W1AMD5_9GAMM|nr:7-cyano-7-deazaguanine/7-aminomethyl-7-deazaguanine transporter [Legionella waltersii]KTD82492.1 membrane protein [Legionella waltersii]SNV02855.1 membrane protein [Legionella waltersii]
MNLIAVRLVLLHLILIVSSNVLVQYPFTLFGFHTTWGAFTYPLIFIVTDLTTRLLHAKIARKIICLALIPGMLCSWIISSWMTHGEFFSVDNVSLRVAFASLLAYALGQLLDITVFNRLRRVAAWWVAPGASTLLGNTLDTFVFFAVAFYHSVNPFLADHWLEIATVDLFFKILISLLSFIPLYGLILRWFLSRQHRAVGFA